MLMVKKYFYVYIIGFINLFSFSSQSYKIPYSCSSYCSNYDYYIDAYNIPYGTTISLYIQYTSSYNSCTSIKYSHSSSTYTNPSYSLSYYSSYGNTYTFHLTSQEKYIVFSLDSCSSSAVYLSYDYNGKKSSSSESSGSDSTTTAIIVIIIICCCCGLCGGGTYYKKRYVVYEY